MWGADRLLLLMAEGGSWLASGPRNRAPRSPLTLPAMSASALWTLPSYLQQDVSETKPTFGKGQPFKKSREYQWNRQEKDKQLENTCLNCLLRLADLGWWPRGLIAKTRQSPSLSKAQKWRGLVDAGLLTDHSRLCFWLFIYSAI